jgi:hypothetical protein
LSTAAAELWNSFWKIADSFRVFRPEVSRPRILSISGGKFSFLFCLC